MLIKLINHEITYDAVIKRHLLSRFSPLKGHEVNALPLRRPWKCQSFTKLCKKGIRSLKTKGAKSRLRLTKKGLETRPNTKS